MKVADELKKKRAIAYVAMLDSKQLEAAHCAMTVEGGALICVTGPAGAGKTALLKLFVIFFGPEHSAVVTPTHGSRVVCQGNIDEALPRTGYKEQLKAETAHAGLGAGWGKDCWEAPAILKRMKNGTAEKAKQTFSAHVLMIDEAVQLDLDVIETVSEVAKSWNESTDVMGGMITIAFFDTVQTVDVSGAKRPVGAPSVFWEAKPFLEAAAKGKLFAFALEKIYRTQRPFLLKLAAALRSEDYDTAEPLIEEAREGTDDGSFTQLVHDNEEIYPLAMDQYAVPGSVRVLARSEFGAEGLRQPAEWSASQRRKLREESKAMVQLHLSKVQVMEYIPVGKGGAMTDNGWRLEKKTLVRIVRVEGHELAADGAIRVCCFNLPGQPMATIREEDVWVNLGREGGWVKVWALPLRYPNIMTVYSAQGSQFPKVHVHMAKFKAKRNLPYTAVTRAMEEVVISGLKSPMHLRELMELHPKSVLYQHEHGAQVFSRARVAAARRDAARM